MRISGKINLKIYLILTVILYSIMGYFIPFSVTNLVCLLAIAIGISVNHLMLASAVSYMASNAASQSDQGPDWKKLGYILFGKFAILGASLLIGIHFMEGLVVIPLISYVLQLGILMTSLQGKS